MNVNSVLEQSMIVPSASAAKAFMCMSCGSTLQKLVIAAHPKEGKVIALICNACGNFKYAQLDEPEKEVIDAGA